MSLTTLVLALTSNWLPIPHLEELSVAQSPYNIIIIICYCYFIIIMITSSNSNSSSNSSSSLPHLEEPSVALHRQDGVQALGGEHAPHDLWLGHCHYHYSVIISCIMIVSHYYYDVCLIIITIIIIIIMIIIIISSSSSSIIIISSSIISSSSSSSSIIIISGGRSTIMTFDVMSVCGWSGPSARRCA